MNEWPVFVELGPDDPNDRARADSFAALQEGRESDASAEAYYVVDPTHSVTGEHVERNICNPDDEDNRRLYTLAFLAPHIIPRSATVGTLSSLTNVPNVSDRLRADETVWFEYLRAQAAIIPADSPWSPENTPITTDESDGYLIRTIRAALFMHEYDCFTGELRSLDEFSLAHIKHVLTTYTRRAGSGNAPDADEVTRERVERLWGSATYPPIMPRSEGYIAVISYIIEHDTATPVEMSCKDWSLAHGYRESEWDNVRLGFEGPGLYDADALDTLLFGDDLRRAYEDALGETFPRWRCGGCGASFALPDDRNQHERDDCPESSPLRRHCEFCDEVFTGDGAGRSRGGHVAKQHQSVASVDARRDIARREATDPPLPFDGGKSGPPEAVAEPDGSGTQLPLRLGIPRTDGDDEEPDPDPDPEPDPEGDLVLSPAFAAEYGQTVLDALLDGPEPDVLLFALDRAEPAERDAALAALVRETDDVEAILQFRNALRAVEAGRGGTGGDE